MGLQPQIEAGAPMKTLGIAVICLAIGFATGLKTLLSENTTVWAQQADSPANSQRGLEQSRHQCRTESCRRTVHARFRLARLDWRYTGSQKSEEKHCRESFHLSRLERRSAGHGCRR